MKTSLVKLLTLGLLLTLATACVHYQREVAKVNQKIEVSPNDKRDYATLTLNNGMTVILVSDPSIDKSAAALSVGVGLLHDPKSQQGMAHYLEHMLFLGTERFPETNGYSEFMAQNGGSANAYTWLDITNYMFEVNNDAFDSALDRFSDFFKAPKLYAEYSEKEVNAVNAEWSMRRESDFFSRFKLDRSMMGEHPANRFLIGNLESLGDKADSKLHPEMVAFYQRYYSANIMKLALISELPIEQMKTLAEKHFVSIKDKKIARPKVEHTLDFKTLGKKRIHFKPNQDVKQLIIDFTIDNNGGEYLSKPNNYVGYLLGSEMPGSPAAVLKQAGLISSLVSSSSPDLYGNYGSLSLTIELTDAGMQKRKLIIHQLMQFIEQVKAEGVDKKYYAEIKTSLDNQFRFLEKGNAFGYVSNLTDEMQSYSVQHVISAPFAYPKFDAQAIKRVLEQLVPERMRIWTISQQEPVLEKMHFYDGEYQIKNISDSEIASWKSVAPIAMNLPKVNTLLPENFDLAEQASQQTSEQAAKLAKPQVAYNKNAIKIWHLPSKEFKSQPKGLVKVYINSPLRQKSASGQVLLSLWTDLYNLNESALSTEASIAGMGLGLIDLHGLELSVSGFTDKQGLLLERGLNALEFKVEEEAFNAALDRYIRGLQNQSKQYPINQLFGFMNKIITRSGVENEKLIALAAKLTKQDLENFMQRLINNNQIRVFVFGNYSKQDILNYAQLIETWLPSTRTSGDYIRSKRWEPQSSQIISFKKDLPVADVAVLDIAVHPKADIMQQARAQVLGSHMRNITFDTLRTEEQLAYQVTSLSTPIEEFTTLGLAIQTPVKGVAEIQKRFDDFKQEYYAKLKKVSSDEFAKLKSSVLVELRQMPKNLAQELGPYINDWYREKWDFDSRERLIAAVEKVSLADLQKFYLETLLNPEAARLSIQLRGSKFKDKPFAKIKGEKEVEDFDKLHDDLRYQ